MKWKLMVGMDLIVSRLTSNDFEWLNVMFFLYRIGPILIWSWLRNSIEWRIDFFFYILLAMAIYNRIGIGF